jgi:hypothetical protein
MMLKAKDKDNKKATDTTDSEVVCGAPTPALARHIPNDATVKALQDTQESHRLSDHDSVEAFLQAIIDS